MQRVDTDPDDLLAAYPDAVRPDMVELDRRIRAAMPGRSRVVWEGTFWGGTDQQIIGYGDLVQPRPRGEDVEWFVVGLARQKEHASLYVNVADDGAYLLRRYEGRLGKVKLGSASVAIRDLARVDLDVLDDLLAEAHRLAPPDR